MLASFLLFLYYKLSKLTKKSPHYTQNLKIQTQFRYVAHVSDKDIFNYLFRYYTLKKFKKFALQ